jgi:hypothetical protein
MNPTKLRVMEGKAEDPFSDFRNFIHYLFVEIRQWEYVGRLQYDIADFVQNLPRSRDGIARGQVQSLRGAGKTEVAVAFALWLLYLDADIKILAISSVLPKAQEFVGLARQLINVTPLLAHLKPHLAKDGLVEKDQKDNEHGFVCGAVTKVSKELSLASFPIFGTYTGSHPDVIISDDVETPENSLTVGKRQRLLSKIYEFADLINPNGIIFIQGTPQTEQSVYLHLEAKGFTLRRWPARAPSLTDQTACINVSPWILEEVKAGRLKPGEPTYPERFNEDVLLERMAFYGPSRFALQMMLDTKLSDGDRYKLKLKNLIVMDCHYEMAPERVVWGTNDPCRDIDPQGLNDDCYYRPAYKADKYDKYTKGVMFIDPKGRGKYTVAYAVVKALNGILYTLDVGGIASGAGNEGFAQPVLEKLARIAYNNQINYVVVESNFGDGMYARLLSPVMARINGPTEVKDRKATKQKEVRILDTFQSLTEAHKLVITPKVASNDKLMHQYTRITPESGSLVEDDELDAWEGACSELKDCVSLDPEKKQLEAKTKEKRAMIRSFQQSAWGFVSGAPNTQGWSSRATRRWGTRPARR